jgi:AmmeMemoRadiSam system protein B
MIREPVVAGRFYEAEPTALKKQIDACLNHKLGAAGASVTPDGKLAGFIAPHAGFIFSGPVATHAYTRMAGEKTPPDTIIILGPKHTHYGADFSISAASAWKTPLGTLEVDHEIRDRLLADESLFKADNDAHAFEHSIEVQLPFIQYFLRTAPKILPIALHYASFADVCRVARSIGRVVAAAKDRHILLIASSDFSHETPRDEAYRIDREVIDRILALDPQGVYNMIIDEERSVCGVIPITALLQILAGSPVHASLLKYATSMDIMRHERGVGYGAIIFEEKA